MRILCVLVCFLMSFSAFSQQADLIGKKVPSVHFKSILQHSEKQADIADFKGKVVILEFWETWCSPCIKALEHLDKIQSTFPESVQVISITSASEQRIKTFLEKVELDIPIVIDSEKKLWKSFPHRVIPHTILIDEQGIVRAITQPSSITKAVIQDILDGKEIDLPIKEEVLEFNYAEPLSGNREVDYELVVTSYQKGLSSLSYSPGKGFYADRRILVVNLAPRSLFEVAFDFPTTITTDIEVESPEALVWSKKTAIAIDLIVSSDNKNQLKTRFKEVLDSLYQYDVRVEKRKKTVQILELAPNSESQLVPSTGKTRRISSSGKGLNMQNGTVKDIVSFIQDQLHVPVVDETGLADRYNLEIAWYPEDIERIKDELLKSGLVLKEGERVIDVLVIRDRK